MSSVLSANRVAALSAFLVAISSGVLAIIGQFPHAWQGTIIWIVSLIGVFGTALHFMQGSQKFDQQQAAIALKQKELEIAQITGKPVATGLPANSTNPARPATENLGSSPWWKGHPEIDPEPAPFQNS